MATRTKVAQAGFDAVPKMGAALKAFVEAGGTLITSNKAADVYATKDNPVFSNALREVPRKEFYCPGSILEIAVDRWSPIE